jgi:hypothetical protein
MRDSSHIAPLWDRKGRAEVALWRAEVGLRGVLEGEHGPPHVDHVAMLMCAARAALGVAMVTVDSRAFRLSTPTGGNPPRASI